MRPPVSPVNVTFSHPGKVKGGQYKAGVDLLAPGAEVVAPVGGKIAHVYPDKTRCGNPAEGSCQVTIHQEIIVNRDRKLTGVAVALAHFVPVAGLSQGALRHVAEGTVIGHMPNDPGAVLHMACNRPARMPELLGQP